MSQKDNSEDGNFWLVILLFVLWLLFRLPLDLVSDKRREVREEKIRTREGLLRERELLLKLLKDKQEIIANINATFKKWYAILRFCVGILWVIGSIAIFVLTGWKNAVGLVVDINGLILFIVLLGNFIVYRKITDTRELIGQMEERMETWFLRNHAGIKEEVVQYNEELDVVESRLVAIEREIREMDAEAGLITVF